MTTSTAIIVLILLLAGNAFFVASEFAMVSARRDQLEPRPRKAPRPLNMPSRALKTCRRRSRPPSSASPRVHC